MAAWWATTPPDPWELLLPDSVDVIVIDDRLPLELAGRFALEGRVLFEDDPAERVRWVAMTRKIWLDERFRFERGHREYLERVAAGGR